MGPNSFVFAYIFTEKCLRRRSTPPLTSARPTPTGNPGSATGDACDFDSNFVNTMREQYTYQHWMCDKPESPPCVSHIISTFFIHV